MLDLRGGEKVDKEIITLSSKPIEISEFKNHKEATFMISVLDEFNLNGVKIEEAEGEKYHKTIIGYPILAYLKYDSNGDPSDFGGHELRVKYNKDTKELEYYFATFPIGSVIDAWIEEREVEGYEGTKKVVMIRTKLWSSRFPEYFVVFDKLWAEGKVDSSWEISVTKSEKTTDGKKILKEFEWIGNTILGSDVIGAVPSAGVVEVSQKINDNQLSLAEALTKDINNIKNSNINLQDVIKTIVSEDILKILNSNIQGGNEMAKKNTTEQSALTVNDLREKLWSALNPKGWSSVPYYSIWNIYPEEHQLICQDWDSAETEDEIIVYSYSVDENDNVTLGESKTKKISDLLAEKMHVNISMNLDDTAKLLSEKETTIKDLEEKLEKSNKELSEKVESVNKLGDEVADLKKQVSELTPFKEQVEKAETEKKEAELAQKKEDLKQFALKGGYITEEEIETSEEIKKMIEEIDETGIKVLRAERIEKRLDETNKEEKPETLKANLDGADDSIGITATSLIASWVKSK